MIEVYRLEIRADIQKGFKNDPSDTYVQYGSGDRLGINETIDLGQLDFLTVCKVLGALHDVASEIKAAHGEVR